MNSPRNPIEFYFDFTSPYSYLASEKIDAIAEKYGRQVQWRPVLLGAIFKALGTVSLVKQPGMADYSERDFSRSARFLDVPYVQPGSFPVSTVAAARAYYWLHGQDCALARRFAHEVFRAYFAAGRDISDAAVVLELATKVSADATAVAAGMQDAAIKERLRVENETVLALGAFGAPWIIVDGEPFWGADRLPQVERWLEKGGF
ncbi:MAG: 2-hydroxychromene-2-carboxylate isomerase [Gammaproteobacteria bacterium]|nr:2-hydroxychromene-2-carboxylate isomerase [Rhodocyclaceae bacterium]MBU3908158.1 2-hydroxychromene-2-carboxylate isomerase [Gammaproteobacteria bacterium]MBU3989753.1 2-hydroxychromene-2-carboxylate isomerase [Gammaproteobacteria bacterium]MBU4005799.1 2-hydroxychromene-2-carboxylate isomerase [Gammaproteobacteria bacterium]MBU4021453.1 2-hydroxychromene-2-carboxylate isomerase [Gammaproteobacteria bacterium]